MGAESERRRVDARHGVTGGIRRPSGDGEAVDAITVAEQRLKLAEMQADTVLAARDLGGIGTTLRDGGDDDGVAGLARIGGDDDAITDAEVRVGGEAAVYCD
jgi:hypothetical protein